MNKLIEILLHNQNQFASGGLLLMAIGSIGALFRNIPNNIWNLIVRHTTLSITITSESQSFKEVAAWFKKNGTKVRSVDIYYPTSRSSPIPIPAPGRHWIWVNRQPLKVSFTRSETGNGYDNKRSETFVIMKFGRNRNFFKTFLTQIRDTHQETLNRKSVYIRKDGYWESFSGHKPRPEGSVILPTGEKDRLIADVRRFLSRESWYLQNGIPYHRGYLLHGLPGTGKTSLVSEISDTLGLPIYFLELANIADVALIDAVSSIDQKSIILMEDIDCVTTAKQRDPKDEKEKGKEKTGFLTLSGLLNTLDGFRTPHGSIFFLTTNKIDFLDNALIRPGRVDYRLAFHYATLDQKQAIYQRMQLECPQDVLDTDLTMAELQQKIMLTEAV